jgi:hypothetical protein
MPLHRDIYWIGRQWAVTGYGIQAIDQKLKGKFDIEAARVWENGLPEALDAKEWLNAEDFGKALAVARKRHPEPPRTAIPADESPLLPAKSAPIAAPKPEPPKFEMEKTGVRGKLVRPWHARLPR